MNDSNFDEIGIRGTPPNNLVYSHVIPEPEEYALVFGLFALAFVIIHRQFKRNRQL